MIEDEIDLNINLIKKNRNEANKIKFKIYLFILIFFSVIVILIVILIYLFFPKNFINFAEMNLFFSTQSKKIQIVITIIIGQFIITKLHVFGS